MMILSGDPLQHRGKAPSLISLPLNESRPAIRHVCVSIYAHVSSLVGQLPFACGLHPQEQAELAD